MDCLGPSSPLARIFLALLRQILAITDHDRQFSRGGHVTFVLLGVPSARLRRRGRRSCATEGNGREASPLRLCRKPLPPVRSVVSWAYGYSDATIWQWGSDAVMLKGIARRGRTSSSSSAGGERSEIDGG